MAIYNTDYLQFNAESMKELIKRKLSEDNYFTDHLFEGSNLSILVDVFAFSYEALMYYINHGASEAIFQDSQIYENINRIAKMLGYNPQGFITPKVTATISSRDTTETVGDTFLQKVLPKYSFVNTQKIDSKGKPIYYSTVTSKFISSTESGDIRIIEPSTVNTVSLYNGRWKLYDRTFVASGIAFEEFVLSLIDMENKDAANFKYVAYPYVHTYIKRSNSTKADGYEYIFFSPVSQGSLFGNSKSTYTSTDNIFELRLNERKQLSLKFGDGIHGSRLLENDEVYVVFMESNGKEGSIGSGILTTTIPVNAINYGIAGLSDALFLRFLNVASTDLVLVESTLTEAGLDALYFNNSSASTSFIEMETVADIKNNAPTWFKIGGRLVTQKDYKQYVLSTFKEDIIDTNVMNVWEYMSQFQSWLYDLGKLNLSIRSQNYFYADSCDFNNIFIWSKFRDSNVDKSVIERDLVPIKMMTAEPIVLNALDTYLSPAVVTSYDINDWDPNSENYIEILREKNSFITPEQIKQEVITTIEDFFDSEKLKIGQVINISDLHSKLAGISGVKQIRTAYLATADAGNCSKTQYIDGLNFAIWTPSLVDGEDLTTTNGNYQLKGFQFPVLLSGIENRIKVVFESFGGTDIEF